ncbi:MAG: hypothetical protein QOI24_1819 [Acidobacteriota bacterium]|jgi:hypothetical protein|nr:hypothetical protein [Acidobacteriota bacterium]
MRFVFLVFLFAVPLIADEAEDVAAARSVFERNIDAIRQRDTAKYLSCYLQSEKLARGGPSGFQIGYAGFSKSAGSAWPDTIDASDIHLLPVQPGVVYGTYRYRVRYGADEHAGISERLFLRTADGWKIAITGAIDAPPGTPAPPRALIGPTLIDGRGGAPIANANVIIRDGKIDCAGRHARFRKG